MYNGEERRKTMDNEIQEMKIELASFTATVKEWMLGTTQYRQDLCRKQDRLLTNQEELTDKFSKLPCGERAEITKNVKKEQDKLWLFVNMIIVAIVGSWIGMMLKK